MGIGAAFCIGLTVLVVVLCLTRRQEMATMTLAKALCIGLIILGVVLGLADLPEARQYVHAMAIIGATRHVWQWGLACVISGVLGIVVLKAAGTPKRPNKP